MPRKERHVQDAGCNVLKTKTGTKIKQQRKKKLKIPSEIISAMRKHILIAVEWIECCQVYALVQQQHVHCVLTCESSIEFDRDFHLTLNAFGELFAAHSNQTHCS